MPTEVSTVCFHTKDAVEMSDDGSFTFEMISSKLDYGGAIKVALASCEMPMVQYTLEREWNRVWSNEGVRVDAANNCLIVVVGPGGAEPCVLALPCAVNPILSVSSTSVVHLAHPHGLAFPDGAHSFAAQATLVGGKGGDAPIGGASYVSDTHLRIPHADASAHFLLNPVVPSPQCLCSMLEEVAGRHPGLKEVRLRFRYEPAEDEVRLTCHLAKPGLQVRVLPSRLASLLGLSSVSVRADASGKAEWPSGPTSLWNPAELPPGYYGPCQRSMCAGSPMHIVPEFEASMNRLYLPILSDSDQKPAHLLIFAGRDGELRSCSLPPGRYTPASISLFLQNAMTAALPDGSGVAFSVCFRPEERRFVLSCHRRRGGKQLPEPFSLLFHHPLSVRPALLGFTSHPLSGSHSYTSPLAVLLPEEGRSNVYRMSDSVQQRTFSFHATAPPTLNAVVGKTRNGADVVLQTFLNGRPYSHGIRAGAAVRLHAGKDVLSLADPSSSEPEPAETKLRPGGAGLPAACTCVVATPGPADLPTSICLKGCPALSGLVEHTHVLLAVDPLPWSLHFGKPGSVPASTFGFPARAVCWGVDGSVRTEEGMLPPFVAPHTHCLDHPDYVCITFSEDAGGNLSHVRGREAHNIFCKLSLYPNFREERMLPRDTLLLRHHMSRFTIRFWNPDMKSPYHFHGTPFSFSLSFISQLG